jgi:hypothetical protein
MFKVYINDDFVGELTESGLFLVLDAMSVDPWEKLTPTELAAWENAGLCHEERPATLTKVRRSKHVN